MEKRVISADDIRRYLSFSEKIAEIESTLYDSGDRLSEEEFKINAIVVEQNKIRFDQHENDIFRDQVESVIRILTGNLNEFGFENDLYFDLVYNLLMLEYERVDQLTREEAITLMLKKIGITDHIKRTVKALLDHEEEGCGRC